MADDTDVLLKMYEEAWEQARQSESQRATVTNIILVIASAILAFIAEIGLSLKTIPLTLLLVIFGVYGAFITLKLYSIFRRHIWQLRLWRKKIDELHPNAQILLIKNEADKEYKKEYPNLDKLPLHVLWLILYLVIALIGVSLTLLVLI